MDRQIEEITAVCDVVRGRKRSKKQLWLAFDEWNVWYRKNTEADLNGQRKEAPHLVEEVYNLEDALVLGGLIITLLRHSDRVRLACLAQLVNDIAPLVPTLTAYCDKRSITLTPGPCVMRAECSQFTCGVRGL